jgi:uncharacterized membrane protein
MTEEYQNSESMHLTKSRLESLTDGIFAFAMTLLVIGLNLPDKSTIVLSNGFAANFLLSLYSDFFHYVLAFLILGAFWLSHHIELHPLQRMNRIYVWLNLGTLMFVALLPFSTSFSGDFPGVPLGSIVFQLNLLIIGVGMYLQWKYATGKACLVEPGLDRRFIRHISIRALVVPFVSLLAICIAITGNPWSNIVYMLLPLMFIITRWVMTREKPSAGSDQ